MHKHQPHEWHETRSAEEGGGKRYMRARWDWRDWRFSILEPEDENWRPIENPGIPEFQALRDVLWRKYQRRRVPYKFVVAVDKILENLGAGPAKAAEDGDEEA